METRLLTDLPAAPARRRMTRMRDGVRGLPHLPERLLHPAHRWLVLRHTARSNPRRVLMVCHGDLCRAPYAARRLQALLAAAGHAHIAVHSAGLLAPGHLPPANAVAVASDLGIDLSCHRSRQLRNELIRNADLVLAMEPAELDAVISRHRPPGGSAMLLGDFDPEPIAARGIPDPYGRSPEAFRACYRRLDRCVAALARALGITPVAMRHPRDEVRAESLAEVPA